MFRPLLALALVVIPVPPLAAQAVSGSRITNAGVLRADSVVEAVFIARTRLVDTVDIGDFASHLLARLGVPPFEDSLAFAVTSDTALVRIGGRLKDFPQVAREELSGIFFFLDSLTPFEAEISMPGRRDGIMRFRLDRVRVAGFPIPEMLLIPALREYDRRYPVLASGGRELLVAMPPEGTAMLVADGIELRMP